MSEPTAVGPIIYDVLGLLEEEEWEKAEKQFFGKLRPTKHFERDHAEMLFEEWVLFEWRDASGSLALERAMASPALATYQKTRCRELFDSQYFSYWQVVDVKLGYGFTIEDLYTGDTYKIRFPRLSQELSIKDMFAARIAIVDGRWHMASGSVESVPVTLDEASHQSFFRKRPENFGIRDARNVVEKSRSSNNKGIELTIDKAARLLTKSIKMTSLDRYVSIDTVRSWIDNDLSTTTAKRKQDPHPPLAMTLLTGLAYGIPLDEYKTLLQAVIHFQKAVATERKHAAAVPTEESQEFFMFATDPEVWRQKFDTARELAHEGDQVASLKMYEEAFATLHKHQGVFADIFRLVFNAAMAAMYAGNGQLARQLVNMSLELNPAYDMALNMKRKFENGELDATITKINLLKPLEGLQLLKSSPSGAWLSPEQIKDRKQRTPVLLMPTQPTVSKNDSILVYLRWLRPLGINFYDNSRTTQISAYNALGEIVGEKFQTIKVGRNDPCPCGSEIKYKKCHGR